MSEGKTIIELLNELTDKTFNFADYYVEIDTATETYKMSFEAFFAGVLAPDGSGNIDVGNNNLINVGTITGLNLTTSGTITANGTGINKILPFIRCSYSQTGQTTYFLEYKEPFSTYGNDNHVFDIEGDRYIVVPGSKQAQFVRLYVVGAVTKTDTGPSTRVRVKLDRRIYNRVTLVESSAGSIELADIETLSSEVVGTTYPVAYQNAFSGLINTYSLDEDVEEIRIYPTTTY